MKKQQVIIALSVLLFLVLVFFMGRDLFTGGSVSQENPAEYNIDKYRIVDTSEFCYHEVKRVPLAFEELNGLATDDKSSIYLAADKTVEIFDSGFNKTGGFLVNEIVTAIATGTEGNLYVAMGNALKEYSKTGELLRSFDSLNSESYITSVVQIGSYIYAADAGNKVVLQFEKSGGRLQKEIGRKDTLRGINGIILPSVHLDVAMGPGEDLWLNNTGRHLLQNFSENGKLNTAWGEASMTLEGFAGCCNPVQFAILPDGKFVTFEKGLDRIKIYDRAGVYECVVTAPINIDEAALSDCSIGSNVHDIAVDPSGKIFVLDADLKMIRVFKKSR